MLFIRLKEDFMKPGYFKRIFSVILAVVMIVTCIASCEVTAAARPARPTFKITKELRNQLLLKLIRQEMLLDTRYLFQIQSMVSTSRPQHQEYVL